jgi:hypothetical protein
MFRYRLAIVFVITQLFLASTVIAGDFSWLPKLDISAKADLPGFNATLSTRFNIGNATIKTVINQVDKPSDAYMVLRLGEISHRPPEYVIKQYRRNKHKGWGALAKSLGIKPGSRAFHELKAGHDLRLSREDHGGDDHHVYRDRDVEDHGHGNSGGDHGKGSAKHKSHGKNK